MRHVWVVSVLATSLLCGAVPRAHADDRALAKEHYIKGTKAYDLGLYDEAVKEYMEAYRIKDDPAILYNLGQAHRLAGHAADAVRFYKMYLTKVPKASNREEVQLKIDELGKLIDQQRKTQNLPPDQTIKPSSDSAPQTATPAPPTVTPAPPTPPPATVAAPHPEGVVTAATSAPAVDTHAGRAKKIAGFAVAGVGVAMLAAGIGLGVTAQSISNELSQPNVVFDKDKHAQGETFGVVGPALIGVGAVAVVTGAVVAGLGFRDAKRARALAVAPSLGPTHASLAAAIQF
jgi:hypothetical protein